MPTLNAGVDEVGRGPLAGPVMAGAVILDPNKPIEGLTDSKLLSPKKREYLSEIIKEKALAWAIGRAEVHEIDSINILQASLLAMERAIGQLTTKPGRIYIDGNQIIKNLVNQYEMKAVIGGDKIIPEISAASIIAKVARDAEMVEYDAIYQGYEFSKHKGYGTQLHRELIKKLGYSPIHRQSFNLS